MAGTKIIAVDYPRNLREFDRLFAHKDACLRFLEQVRWGDRGFACQSCGGREFWTLGTGLRRCKGCRFKNSVKTGTIFESSRLPLKMWFYAVWWITAQKTGVSALDLQRDVGLGSYRSAWLLLHKIRNAMTRADRTLLSGDVEIGELKLGVNPVYVAAEFSGAKRIGRVRLSRASGGWEAFLQTSVAKGTALHAPAELGRTVPRAAPLPVHSRVPLLGDQLSRWLKGTLHGRLESKHLESYLEEFTFRFNHREAKSRGILFQRVMENAVRIEPAPYRSITARKA
jgi:hypothetical protein